MPSCRFPLYSVRKDFGAASSIFNVEEKAGLEEDVDEPADQVCEEGKLKVGISNNGNRGELKDGKGEDEEEDVDGPESRDESVKDGVGWEERRDGRPDEDVVGSLEWAGGEVNEDKEVEKELEDNELVMIIISFLSVNLLISENKPQAGQQSIL